MRDEEWEELKIIKFLSLGQQKWYNDIRERKKKIGREVG